LLIATDWRANLQSATAKRDLVETRVAAAGVHEGAGAVLRRLATVNRATTDR